MNKDSALDLLRRGRSLAASVPAEREGTLAWAGVYPLDLTRPNTAPVLRRLGVSLSASDQPVFRIRVIEINASILGSGACISEEELRSRADMLVVGEESLFAELERLGVPSDNLELPYKVDYPI